MGMFDWYTPKGDLRCPRCGTALREWQGKAGANALVVWTEGEAAPVDQRIDFGSALSSEQRSGLRLPATFNIHSYDCPTHRPVAARCRVESGVWCETVVEMPEPVRPTRDDALRI